ncbi:MAG TPA: polyketide cyclase [Dongiaceae bacterium]|nr:polyketide cyclase [Dongiaceae bacterium]
MSQGFPSLHLSVWIDRDLAGVYDFLHRPENFPLWASGLAGGLQRLSARAEDALDWLAAGPDGEIRVRFSPRNEYGVVDHWVFLPGGQVISVPLRVIANAGGSEVTLTLFRLPEMSDAVFARDTDWVRRDLARLKELLQS